MRAPDEGGDTGGFQGRRDLDAKQIAELKKLYGFDKPALVRYVDMLGSFARFDLGRSFMRNKDVWPLIKEKLPVSISLGLWTFLISYLISIPLGVAKAVREGSRFDTVTTLLVLIGLRHSRLRARRAADRAVRRRHVPRLVPAARADLRQLDGALPGRRASLDYFWHLVLPLTCYAIGSFAVITMLTKNTFVEEIRKQYVLVARAKGLSERRVLYQARVPQCADSARHRIPGGVRRRVLRRRRC